MSTNNDKRYCLVQDDSAHYYLCPAEKRPEASEYFEAMRQYWRPSADRDEMEQPEEPEGLQMIDGFHRLTFTDPQVR